MIKYRCGGCGNEMQSPEAMIGQMEHCPHCGYRQKVLVDVHQEPERVKKLEMSTITVATGHTIPRVVTAPNYGAVKSVGTILIAEGVVTIVVGLAIGILGIASGQSGPAIGIMLGATVTGTFLYGAGQLLFCVRDMAQNSFVRPK